MTVMIGIDPHKAQQLVAAGEIVVDVPPVMSTRTRLLGSGKAQKKEPNDARSVAIAALRNDGLGRVVLDDHARVLKLLVKRHRDLGRLKNKAACRLHALLMELEPGGMAKEMSVTRANEILDRIEPATQMQAHRLAVARETLADIAHYETQMKASMKRLRTAVARVRNLVVDIHGVGVVVAAMIIGHTGDVARFASAGHFASYNATAPIEASSGREASPAEPPAATDSSIGPSTLPRFTSCASRVPGASTTTANTPKARTQRKRSER